ncbi:MAG TPA: nucleoside triphosphate pyrophosphatase [Gemmatimonadota bacterium]|nr:nucleoside triphosphate pyrophosphatase [Gemmatimonadota bacterium]
MSGASAPPIVLASGSPRRRELLARLGLRFEVDPPRRAEDAWSAGEDPDVYAGRIAAAKAAEVAERRPDALVVAGDTIVVLDGDVLGKPGDAVSARAMLARLSGREHAVHTALTVIAPGGVRATGTEITRVRFRTLGAEEIDAYVATGEPLDKAGAYGIQAFGAILVEGVRGCYFNVMGLPLVRLLTLLDEVGWAYRLPGRFRAVGPAAAPPRSLPSR